MKRLIVNMSLIFLTAFCSCGKDRLSPFEQAFVGQWTSVSYKRGSVDHSGEYKAGLSLKDDGDFLFTYQYRESAFSYILTYEQKGAWSGNDAEQEIAFEESPGFWSGMAARAAGADSLYLTGSLDGTDAEIIFTR